MKLLRLQKNSPDGIKLDVSMVYGLKLEAEFLPSVIHSISAFTSKVYKILLVTPQNICKTFNCNTVKILHTYFLYNVLHKYLCCISYTDQS